MTRSARWDATIMGEPILKRNRLDLRVEYISPNRLKPYPQNARIHSRKQIRTLASSIRRFGFLRPVLTSKDLEIIAGHGCVEAAKLEGMATVPTVQIEHLSEVERRAYVLADNQLALQAGWDREILSIELQSLIEVGFDVEIMGFEAPEVDGILDAVSERDHDPGPEDLTPSIHRDKAPITSPGDLWQLPGQGDGCHRVLCGDAQSPSALAALLGNDVANMVITDPPYNVPIQGHVSGKGRTQHVE